MIEFWIAFSVFIASHSGIARSRLRDLLAGRLGEKAYLAVYSLFSLGILAWLIAAAQDAPRTPLWPFAPELYWAPNIMMPFACILLAAGFVVSNPLSIAPRDKGFKPEKPGLIVAMTRHPAMWGFFLWSFSHLFPNGEFPLAFMFGFFALFSLAGLFILDRKRRREMGDDEWRAAAVNTSAVLLAAPALWTGRFRVTRRDAAGIVLGLALYGILYGIHGFFFGIVPTPPI